MVAQSADDNVSISVSGLAQGQTRPVRTWPVPGGKFSEEEGVKLVHVLAAGDVKRQACEKTGKLIIDRGRTPRSLQGIWLAP